MSPIVPPLTSDILSIERNSENLWSNHEPQSMQKKQNLVKINKMVPNKVKKNINKKGKKKALKLLNKEKYKKDECFYFIYANTPGYAAVDGGSRGGYLIRSFTKVFNDNKKFECLNLYEMVLDTRKKCDKLIGKVGAQVIEIVDRMPYKAYFADKV